MKGSKSKWLFEPFPYTLIIQHVLLFATFFESICADVLILNVTDF
jgi:hypothetical protein